MGKVTTSQNAGNTFPKCDPVNGQEVGQNGTNQLRLRNCLVELSPENLIACCRCHTVADISITGSRIKLLCPRCYETLGNWTTTSEAIEDMRAFVASGKAGE